MNEGLSTTDFGRGQQALRLLSEAIADICDVSALGDDEAFHAVSWAAPTGKGVLLESQASALRYERTAHHVAASGIDHYQVALCLGEMEFSSGRRTMTMRPGDIGLIDMAQANSTRLAGAQKRGPSHVLTLVLPRPLLAPLLASPDSATASLIARETLAGQRLAEGLTALRRRGAFGDPESAAAVEAIAGAVAGVLGRKSDAEAVVDRADRHLLIASIKRYIDANLQTEMGGADRLCRRFGLSRATLYRLFEPEGGLARYIQEQRLNRAFARLISPAAGEVRMLDLALEYGFGSDSAFVRAFRRQFGLTPGEARRLARSGPQIGRLGADDPRHALARLGRDQT